MENGDGWKFQTFEEGFFDEASVAHETLEDGEPELLALHI